MPSTPLRGAARLLPLVILFCATIRPETAAAVRTRSLPSLAGRVEPSLVARAAALSQPTVHAIVEVSSSPAGRRERGGVRLLRSIDGDLWLASIATEAIRANALPPVVVAAWDLRPADRVDPDLLAELGSGDGLFDVRVKIFRDEEVDPVRGAIRREGGVIRAEAPRLGVLDVRVSRAAAMKLAARDDVRWMERAPRDGVVTNDSMRLAASVNPVQALGIDGAGVLIGMWDSGLADSTHPDLAGRIEIGESGLSTQIHATHVAGTAIGDGSNSQSQGGIPDQWRGVATGADIVGYGLFGAIADIDSAIQVWDIDLSTNSWVMPVDSTNCSDYGAYAFDAPEFDEIVTGIYGKRLPVVFAAGNERDDPDCGIPTGNGYGYLPPPATAKNVISVGAHQSDSGLMTTFSSWGPTGDGRMKPDVAAPGCQGSIDFGLTSTLIGGGYTVRCGTSMATPVVSGSAATLIQEWRAHYPGDPRPASVKALLGGFAADRFNLGPDYRFGLGAINLQASVTALQTSTTIQDRVNDGGADAWDFFVPPGVDTLRVTLAWDDPAGAELADTVLVNDLDLTLRSPTAETLYPLVLDPGDPAAPATAGVNRLDNVEQVVVLSPGVGTWRAVIEGTSVPDGPQRYSLVGFDRRPPADPAAATATAVSDFEVELTWVRPGDADRAGTLVARSTGAPITWTPAVGTTYSVGAEPQPGVFVIVADDADHSAAPFVDQPLDPGLIHHYAFFSYDEIPNYSPGVGDTARTSSPSVSSPPPLASAATVSFERTGANPFRDRTAFRFQLPGKANVTVDVHDATGRRVITLVDGPRKAGSHLVEWTGRAADGRRAAAGIYFVRFRGGGLTATEKLVVVR